MKKSLTIILTVVLLFNVVAFSTINVAAHQPDPPIKLYNYIDTYTAEELELLTSNPDDYYVSVFVSFNYSKMDSRELDELEKSTRLDLIRNYYGTRNLLLANELGIPTDTVSLYTPFAELSYATLAEYEQNESFICGLAESVDVAFVEISIKKAETHGTRAANVPNEVYDTATVFAHTGITDHTYTGDGIKIGFVEKSTIQGATYFPDGHLTQHGGFVEGYDRYHAYYVASVAAGTQGIAFDAYCYVSSLANNTWRSALEWLINNNVDVINISVGDCAPNGAYNQLAAYIDYLIDITDILVVVASGLDEIPPVVDEDEMSTYYLRAPAVCANAVTVFSVDTEKNVIFSPSPVEVPVGLAKPDMVAPGKNISMVPNPLIDVTGSSYSAAIVTGIVARLLEEYPILKNNAHLLKAVLTASCVNLPMNSIGQDQYAGAGLINYNNARTIMQNHQYQIHEKYYDDSDGVGMGYIALPEVPAGSSINLRYVIPVSGMLYTAPNADSEVALESFSRFTFIPMNTVTEDTTFWTTYANTGMVYCPRDDSNAMQYNVDVYLEENRSNTENEYLVVAYCIY